MIVFQDAIISSSENSLSSVPAVLRVARAGSARAQTIQLAEWTASREAEWRLPDAYEVTHQKAVDGLRGVGHVDYSITVTEVSLCEWRDRRRSANPARTVGTPTCSRGTSQ
jgi:hypothetical protein